MLVNKYQNLSQLANFGNININLNYNTNTIIGSMKIEFNAQSKLTEKILPSGLQSYF